MALCLIFAAPPAVAFQKVGTGATHEPAERSNSGQSGKTAANQPGSDHPLTVDEFIAELTTLSDQFDNWDDQDHVPSAAELHQLRTSLPQTWSIQTDDANFVISSGELDALLATGNTDDAENWIDHTLGEAKSYAKPQRATTQNAREQLNQILASQEFTDVHPINAWQLFRQRAAAWFARMLYRLFGGLQRYPIVGDILFWGILLLAVGFLARWLVRFLMSRDRLEGLANQEIGAATHTWQEWIRLAKEAAALQDFRNAIHSVYWAAIARLEDEAVLPRDRAKTPRERLAFLSRLSQQEPAASPLTYTEPLKTLTTRLERVWYANRGAKAEDFEDSLNQLKALGCQLE